MSYTGRVPGKSERTKKRILAAALELFNERGTARVDTHDIAKGARMSPGNLYYHYRGKTEIIRDLFEEIELYSERAWRRRGPANPSATFAGFMEFFFGSARRHRFFFLEFSPLLKHDAELGRRWRARHRRLSTALTQAARGWVDAGLMTPFADAEELQSFVDNAWILCHYAAAYVEAKSLVAPETAHRQGLSLLLSFLAPYHTARGRAELDRYAATLST